MTWYLYFYASKLETCGELWDAQFLHLTSIHPFVILQRPLSFSIQHVSLLHLNFLKFSIFFERVSSDWKWVDLNLCSLLPMYQNWLKTSQSRLQSFQQYFSSYFSLLNLNFFALIISNNICIYNNANFTLNSW